MERRSKYGSKKTTYNGKKYDSKKEAQRAVELELLESAGKIFNLKSQVHIELFPAFTYEGKKIRSIVYVADFTYNDPFGIHVIEDSKGFKTKEYLLKKKLLLYKIASGEFHDTIFLET